MQNRLRIAIFVAILFGAITAYGISNYLRQQRLAIEEMKRATQDVVVATKEIPAGTTITTNMVKVTPYLKTSLPPGSFSSPQQVTDKTVRTAIAVGEPILQSRLGEKGGLTVLLTPGHRAMAVKVNEIIGVSGFISPNDRVDVIAKVGAPGSDGAENQISKIVLQNKRVLSVAQAVEERKDGKPQVASSITLELTPEEAEKMTIASLEGQIVLVLRSQQDENIVRTQGSTTRDLLSIAAPAAPTPAAPIPYRYRVEVYSGGKKSEVEF